MAKQNYKVPKVQTHLIMPFRHRNSKEMAEKWDQPEEIKQDLFLFHEDAEEKYFWRDVKWDKSAHLLNYVNKVVSAKEKDVDSGMRVYRFDTNKNGYVDLPNLYTPIKINDKYKIEITNLELFYFKSGIGFLDVLIDYDVDDIRQIPDILYIIKKVNADTNRKLKKYSYEKDTGKDSDETINVKHSPFEKIIGNFSDSDADSEIKNVEFFFFNGTPVKYQAFVYNVVRLPEENSYSKEDIDQLSFQLMRGYNTTYKGSIEMISHSEVVYQPYPYISWLLSQEGVSCIYYCNQEGKISGAFEVNTFENNLNRDWRSMFLLLLHQKYGLYHFMEEMLQKRQDPQGLKDIQKRFLDFQMYYAFNVVSDERTYHHVYLEMKKVLSLPELYADIQDVTNKIVDNNAREEEKEEQDEKNRADRRQGAVGLLLALIAMVSVVTDATSAIINYFHTGEIATFSWVGIAALVILLVVVCIYIGRPKRIFNKKRNLKK